MVDDYNTDSHHMRKDIHEAHSASQVAKLLATLALIGMIIALALSIWALDKAGSAQSDANRATDAVERMR